MNKADLRKQVMERVRRMTMEERQRASKEIADRIINHEAYQQAGTVMAYYPMPTEVDTRGIMDHAAQQGKTVLLPRCQRAPEMEALPWRGMESMRPGPWGILEPMPWENPGLEKIPEPDLILVPCVAATRNGQRLGHGAGYYDWFLRDRSAMTICLCFQTQLIEALPAEAHDVPMDLVVWA